MSIYRDYCLPCFLDWGCGRSVFGKQRAKIVPLAEGRVLEVGFGSGRNLPYYDPAKVSLIWGLEPSAGMRRIARKRTTVCPIPVEWIGLCSEAIPLDTNSVDTVLMTYTLCSIGDCDQALRQMRRVLKPAGKLLFCEHGLAPDAAVACWQHRLTPLWVKLTGGCHLDRPIVRYIETAGFEIETLALGYLPNIPKVGGYHFRGVATQNNRK
jgi:ubiquinone/menaquinone biosynthesis C-methylase UbiE